MSDAGVAGAVAGPPSADGPGADEVELVRVDLRAPDELVAAYRALLSPEECVRADRFVTAELTRRFVVCRGALRKVLGDFVSAPPRELSFVVGPHGKPSLADPRLAAEFNVSHTGNVALFAVSRLRTVGVDVETICDRVSRDELASRFFSAREREAYFALPESRRREAFFRVWTCKEAFLKAIGAGLSFPLGRFSVSVAPDEPPGLIDVQDDPRAPQRWSYATPIVGKEVAAALVVDGAGWTLRCREWSHRDGMGINCDFA